MHDSLITRPPVRFWIIAALAVLWNAIGAFDYLATQLEFESYMAGFNEEQLGFFYGLPTWVVACWAIAVWSALLASLAMLARRRFAFHLFVLSLVTMLATALHNHVLADGTKIMGAGGLVFSVVIAAIAIFLVFYSRAMSRRGVLR